MQANPVKLLRLLGESNIIFKIPVYQRNYEWKEEQVRQFFYDIEKIIDQKYEKSHFMGTIVYVQKEVGSLLYEKILIDGQQRITTSILLLKAIMDLAKETDNDNIKIEQIYEDYLINKHVSDQSRLRLKPVEADMGAFHELMLNNPTESKIYYNYNLLKTLLIDSEYLLEDIYKALMYVDIVYISLDRDENPQVIFESLNSTGLSLTQADLIRNFILMGLEYDEQTKLYKQYWIKIEELLTNSVISDYVRDFLSMESGKIPNKNKVYEEFKIYYFEKSYNSKEILEELLIYAKYYYYIINSYTGIKKIDIELQNINNIKSTVTYPFLLKLLDDFYRKKLIDEEELLDVLKILVSYIYRRNICNIPSNTMNKLFTIMPREIKKLIDEDLSYIEAVTDFLMSKTSSSIFPRDDEFKNNFININIYDRKPSSIAKFILYRIEEYIHKEVVSIDNLSLEHILPQTLTPEWNIELGKRAFETYNLYKDTIGNLALTNYNSEMSNKSFNEKKFYYRNSNIKTTREIYKYNEWNETSIKDRAEKLFEVAKNIWKLPEDNYKNIGKERLIPNQEYSILDNVVVTGYTPKAIIFDGDRFSVTTWKKMLLKTCKYLFALDEDLFKSLINKSNFKNIISYNKYELRSPEEVSNGIYIQTRYSSKDILNYIVLFSREFKIEDLIFFEIS